MTSGEAARGPKWRVLGSRSESVKGGTESRLWVGPAGIPVAPFRICWLIQKVISLWLKGTVAGLRARHKTEKISVLHIYALHKVSTVQSLLHYLTHMCQYTG